MDRQSHYLRLGKAWPLKLGECHRHDVSEYGHVLNQMAYALLSVSIQSSDRVQGATGRLDVIAGNRAESAEISRIHLDNQREIRAIRLISIFIRVYDPKPIRCIHIAVSDELYFPRYVPLEMDQMRYLVY